jgi:hypothetical protein
MHRDSCRIKLQLIQSTVAFFKRYFFKTDEMQAVQAVHNPSRENIRIVHYWADGVGTYTPMGTGMQ